MTFSGLDELLEMTLGCSHHSQCEGSQILSLLPFQSRDSSCPDQRQSEGSQKNSSSDDIKMNVSSFLEAFPNPPQLMRYKSECGAWVFCSQSENNSSSVYAVDVGNMIHEMIISAFANIDYGYLLGFVQFWAPVTIDGRLLLSISGQPFAVTHLTKSFSDYRVDWEKYKYNTDVKTEGDPMIMSGGPAIAFLNRLPYTILLEDNYDEGVKFSLMLPLCFPSGSSCVGVVELTFYNEEYYLGNFLFNVIEEIKEAGLDVCNVQEQIPYKTINGLRPAKDKIKHALEIVCRSHKLRLAQVWIGVKDKSHVPLSSYLEDTPRVFGLKLTSYLHDELEGGEHEMFEMYNRFCDIMPWGFTQKHALKTLQDFKSRYIYMLKDDLLLYWKKDDFMVSSLVICLRSIDTGDFNFVFEFTWFNISRWDIFLEALLLTLKSCLPSFKFACGAELGDELDVIDIQTHTHGIFPAYNEICNFKIFQGKTLSPLSKAMEEGKQLKAVRVTGVESQSRGETSNIKVCQGKRLSPICKSVEEGKKPMVKCKTAEILLTREDIEKHFDKTMKEAAQNLKVSESTLKRKLRKLGIREWPRTKPVKRNKKDLSVTQIDTTEEDNGAIQEPSTVTIKAEYAGRMIKSCLLISEATFETVVKEIGVKFKLSSGTYDLTYLDEDGDWILLTSDEDMSDCIRSSRKSDRILVRLRVLPST